MHEFETIDLGSYRRRTILVVGFVEPKPIGGEGYEPDEDAENYGVALVDKATAPLEENVEILTMDTRHGRPHLDKEYLPEESAADEKIWLDEDHPYGWMWQFLLENWKHYVDRYIAIHS